MTYDPNEIIETIHMTEVEHLDIRTVTLGVSLRDCSHPDPKTLCANIRQRLLTVAENHVKTVETVSAEFGIPIANKRIAVTPISVVADGHDIGTFIEVAETLDACAAELGIDYLAGYSALVQKGMTIGDKNLIESIPDALASTKRICSSINVASTLAGINMDAIAKMAHIIKALAEKTDQAIGCCKLVVFANAVEDNPFIAGAFHGISEPQTVINVGISGPGVVLNAIKRAGQCDLGALAEVIKRTAFKVTRMGEMVGRKVSERLGVEFGIIDLSLAPTPAEGDSVADILEAIGVERCGCHGTTAALMMLNDAVKKGGLMASSYVGGLSGAFIPVSEDAGMIRAVEAGALSLEKLEAMTAVCSVGLDMVAVPGDTPAETIAGIIADECAIGVVNHKTTAVRIIPVPGKMVGQSAEYGGLLGTAPIQPVSKFSSRNFILRGGRIPAPSGGIKN
ncbi:MAG TPA: PFL family protein [candidate division Zixibacteria bacterium]|nr:PFL family protein [candidate division Zixibacteria bacterium]